jgi:hypothetical protein
MASERWRQVEALYEAALERDATERSDFLSAQCGGDDALRQEVESLLRHGVATRAFFDGPAPELVSSPQSESAVETVSLSSAIGGGLPTARPYDDDFQGTDRFSVIRRLGVGGMGVVYEVRDVMRNEVVALKTLRHATPTGLYRLKQEFRSLADITHPNIVCLYELVVHEAQCFFTMELVRGLNFVDYVRQGAEWQSWIDRLQIALPQLVDGVSALHRSGKLHRDIKPSNVLVTPEGRVVILDFGLIAELFPHAVHDHEHVPGGTPAYLPPEQGLGVPPSEAGDWYGVGGTLYAALTGEVPFTGPLLEVLIRKRESDPPSPSVVAPDVPMDLNTVCMGLMCRDPAERLTGPDALDRLGWHPHVSMKDRPADVATEVPFIGRRRELAVLDDAFQTVAHGGMAAICVSGPSGIGKSALVRSFLDRIMQDDAAVVLPGRCYEHESVPYKALDGVVDSLARYLVSLPRHRVEELLPPDIVAVPRLFPVTRSVPAIAQACRVRAPATAEPLALRHLAFDTLRQLLANLASSVTVVIAIDDLQWTDVDGALLLEELVRQPGAPPLLTIVSFRSQEVAANPFLTRLIEGERGTWRPLVLEPMTEVDAGEMIGAVGAAGLSAQQRQRITVEARGNPFFIEQLSRYATTQAAGDESGPTFVDMFTVRVRRLPETARAFLRALAVCARPMAPELVCEASGLPGDARSLVMSLRSGHFIRSSGSSDRVEPYHDRIREALAAQLSAPEARRIHARLADTLVARGFDDPEALFEHYRGADDRCRAAIQAGRAAERAAVALAFDRAALFYRHALDLNPDASNANESKEGYARALANAGRPAEAADAYLAAAYDAPARQRIELQQRGAEQFLIGGHIDRGLDLIRTVLTDMGVRVPRGPRTALLSMLWERTRMRWRGLDFVSRRAEDIDADLLLRVDTCWSAVTGLLLVDMVSAGYFCARHLRLALDAGEPSRIARGMAVEATAHTAYSTGRRLAARLVRHAQALAESVGNPHSKALSILAEGITAMAVGSWKKGWMCAQQALVLLRECPGATWEMNIAQNVLIWALMYMGELGDVSRLVPPLLAHARRSGNLYIATELCTRSNYVWLAADNPDEGEREAIESIARWSHKGFHRQHYSALLARVQTALYRGDGDIAWRLFTGQEKQLHRSLLTQFHVLRVEALYMRARSALAIAAGSGGDKRFLSIARASAQRIATERAAWSDPIGMLVSAGIANVEGNRAVALQLLHEALGRFERADMNLYANVTRRRIGVLQQGATGRELLGHANAWMAAQQIKNPMCMTRMLAPGFSDEA